jgi:hypothetical protein
MKEFLGLQKIHGTIACFLQKPCRLTTGGKPLVYFSLNTCYFSHLKGFFTLATPDVAPLQSLHGFMMAFLG